MNAEKNISVIKTIGVLLLGILGLWLIYTLLFGAGSGLNLGFGGNYGGGHMTMGVGAGFGAAGTISFLLLFLIKVLFVLFIIGLVVGILLAVKNYVFTQEDIQKIKGTFSGKKAEVIKETCSSCGNEMSDAWKLCPFCGKEKEIINS